MAETHERTVRIVLELVKAQSTSSVTRNVQNEIRDIGKEATKTTRSIRDAYKSIGGTNWAPIVADAKRYRISLDTLTASLNQVDKASLRAYLSNQNLAKSQTATARAVQDSSRATQQAMGHYAAMGTSFSRLTSSAARLARGIGLVFIANEKDREKFMESLVKIIAYTDIFAGGINTIANATRMWLSYSKAVQIAAGSHTALAVSQGGSVTAMAAATAATYAPRTSFVGGKAFTYVPRGAPGGTGANVLQYGLGAAATGALAGDVGRARFSQSWRETAGGPGAQRYRQFMEARAARLGGVRTGAAVGGATFLGRAAPLAGGAAGGGMATAVGVFTVAVVGAVAALAGLENVTRKLKGEPGPGPITEKIGGFFAARERGRLKTRTDRQLEDIIAGRRRAFEGRPETRLTVTPLQQAIAQEMLSERRLAGLETKGARATIEAQYQAKKIPLEAQQARERMRESGTVTSIRAEIAKAKLQGEKAHLAVLKEVEGMYRERLTTAKSVTAETQKQVAVLQQQYNITARIVGLGQTGIERWVTKTPRERARFLRAKEKLEKGEKLTLRDFQELQTMRGVGTAIDPKIIEAYIETAKKLPSTVKALGADYLSQFAIARAGEKILKVQLEDTKETLTIRVRDEAEMGKQLKAFAKKIVEDIRRERRQDLEAGLREAEEEKNVQINALH